MRGGEAGSLVGVRRESSQVPRCPYSKAASWRASSGGGALLTAPRSSRSVQEHVVAWQMRRRGPAENCSDASLLEGEVDAARVEAK